MGWDLRRSDRGFLVKMTGQHTSLRKNRPSTNRESLLNKPHRWVRGMSDTYWAAGG